MKITKFVHSCLLVETPDRVAIFDPGAMSEPAFDMSVLSRLDDIFITHAHQDHFSLDFVKKLVTAYPGVRITSTQEVADELEAEGITAGTAAPDGAKFFDSPHEGVKPLFNPPQEVGVHYLETLSHPGDSHSFKETMPILALPVTAPWGSSATAANLALELKPQHILPIHDWHWRDEAREQMYNRFEQVFGEAGITFHKLETGLAVEIDL